MAAGTLILLVSTGVSRGDAVVNMRKVTHQTISEELSRTILLPCLFTLRPGSSHEPPRIKWTKVWGQRGSDGLQKEQSVLVAKDNVVKVLKVLYYEDICLLQLETLLFPALLLFFLPQVKKAFQGRVTLPGYNENRYNASLALSGLRSSDSGLYRCEVVVGINDEQDTVPLEVTGRWKGPIFYMKAQLALCLQSPTKNVASFVMKGFVGLTASCVFVWSRNLIVGSIIAPCDVTQDLISLYN